MAFENVQTIEKVTSLDRWLEEQPREKEGKAPHPLDTIKAKAKQKKLLEWHEQERERQAENRYQQAIEQDFYDNLQWSDEDAQELLDRGQAPLVFNIVAPTCDWVIGTEKRTRVDFKVFPRAEDDVKTADAKTKTLKFLGDVNKVTFHRSLAFADTVKVGIGWLEDGARDDPTEEPIFSRYESWRNILWDSMGKERDLSDGRYLFRDRWVDLDIAIAMFPDRARELRTAAIAANLWGNDEDEDFWYLGRHFQARDERGEVIYQRRTFLADVGHVNNRRARVKLIEAWYRMPEVCRYCDGSEFDGMRFDSKKEVMLAAFKRGAFSLYDRIEMVVWCAIMTEKDLMQDMRSPYRHNRFPFTPIWCYRRGRDGMPYGLIRRLRDPQEDYNKRASKALFIMSTKGVVADADAVENHDEAREEVARPDYYIIKKRGAEFRVDQDKELAQEHLLLMDRDERMVQHSGGVTDDNLGRRTNAISGEAIKARQLQGSVVTAEVFDNLRFAVQYQGEIQLSLAEQFITAPKVIRLIGARGSIEWLKINQPEVDAMGNVRWVNDITAAKADFVVDEQDFHQSLRQAMFESMVDLVGRIAAVSPEAALRILKMALEFSDLPNKAAMAKEIAEIVGISDKKPEDMTPEEQAEFQQKQQAAQEAAMLQRRAAVLALREQEARINKLNAEAQKALASIEGAGLDDGERAQLAEQMRAVQEEALKQIAELQQEVRQLEQVLADKRYEINVDAAVARERNQLDAETKVRITRIQQVGEKRVEALEQQINEVAKKVATKSSMK